MTFSVTVLGSSSAIPTLSRNPSAQLVNANERLFLVDCAEGTQLQLRRYHIRFQRIRHILISHLHGDHYYGLIGLITSFHLLGRKEPLHIHALPALKQIIDIQLEASDTRLNYQLVFHELDPSGMNLIFEDDKFEVFSFPLLHSVPTCGFLFRERKGQRNSTEGPRSYAYCSDTGYTESIVQFIREVSLLYHEATFLNNMEENARQKFHSTSLQAAMIARSANVKKLMIGHYSARYDDISPLLAEAKTLFPNTITAEDGITINL